MPSAKASDAAPLVVAVTDGDLHVGKDQWRSAASRAAFRAAPGDLEVSDDALAAITDAGRFVVIGPEGVVRATDAATVGPFSLTRNDAGDAVAVHLGQLDRWVRPARAPRALGTIGPGDCLEVAWNSRSPSKRLSGRGPMLYSDHVWRIWVPTQPLVAGAVSPPAPTRVVDLRVILH